MSRGVVTVWPNCEGCWYFSSLMALAKSRQEEEECIGYLALHLLYVHPAGRQLLEDPRVIAWSSLMTGSGGPQGARS